MDDPDYPQGCVVSLIYPNKTAWLGFFMLRAPVRGRGWGAKLFQVALDRFKAEGVEYAGLDAVQEQVGTYSRRGFIDVAKIHVMKRDEGKPVPPRVNVANDESGESSSSTKHALVSLHDVSADLLLQSDLQHTGLSRKQLWSSEGVLGQEQAWGLAMLGKDVKDLQGWAAVRPCDLGWRIGPLYADSVDVARTVLHAVLEGLEEKSGSMAAEIWDSNSQAVKLFTDLGWDSAGVDYRRMWLDGQVPPAQAEGGRASTGMFATFDAGDG